MHEFPYHKLKHCVEQLFPLLYGREMNDEMKFVKIPAKEKSPFPRWSMDHGLEETSDRPSRIGLLLAPYD
jgi:hypothetical protein